jgi:hypothetical protein
MQGEATSRLLKETHLRRPTFPADGYPVLIERWVTPPCIWAFLSSLGETSFSPAYSEVDNLGYFNPYSSC